MNVKEAVYRVSGVLILAVVGVALIGGLQHTLDDKEIHRAIQRVETLERQSEYDRGQAETSYQILSQRIHDLESSEAVFNLRITEAEEAVQRCGTPESKYERIEPLGR